MVERIFKNGQKSDGTTFGLYRYSVKPNTVRIAAYAALNVAYDASFKHTRVKG